MISGKTVWYVLGRMYTDANDRSFDAGFFTHIDGISAPFFKGKTEDETSAYFTFYADQFESRLIQNGDIAAALAPPGQWSMYCIPSPNGNWNTPSTFKGTDAQKIATWQRASTSMSALTGTNTVEDSTQVNYTAGLSVLTFELVEAVDFEWQGQTYNLNNLFPDGVTQFGFSSPSPLPPIKNYPTIKPFAGSAILVGGH